MAIFYGYGRTSTEEQGERYSPERQWEVLQKRAQFHGLEFRWFFDDFSGADFDRPAYQQMMATIQPGDWIGVTYLDRLSRASVEDAIREVKTIHAKGVLLEIGGVVLQPHDPVEKFQFGMQALVSEFFLNLQRKKSLEGIELKKKKGEWIFSNRLYGYHYDPKTKQVSVVENEAIVIKQIFDLYSDGVSPIQIAKRFNAEKVLKRNDTKWNQDQIRKIVLNPIYTGYYPLEKQVKSPLEADPLRFKMRVNEKGRKVVERKIVYSHKIDLDALIPSKYYPPIISIELFRRIINNFRTVTRKHTRQYAQRTSKNLLSGLIGCEYCKSVGTNVYYVHSWVKPRDGRSNEPYEVYESKKHAKGCPTQFKRLRKNIFDDLISALYQFTMQLADYNAELIKEEVNKLDAQLTDLYSIDQNSEGEVNRLTKVLQGAEKRIAEMRQKIIVEENEAKKSYFEDEIFSTSQIIKTTNLTLAGLREKMQSILGEVYIYGEPFEVNLAQPQRLERMSLIKIIDEKFSLGTLKKFQSEEREDLKRQMLLEVFEKVVLREESFHIDFKQGIRIQVELIRNKDNKKPQTIFPFNVNSSLFKGRGTFDFTTGELGVDHNLIRHMREVIRLRRG